MIEKWTESVIKRLVKEGRGQGEGKDYIPWLTYNDFSSRGKTRSVWGLKTPRMHHFFSQHEFDFFICAEWSDQVVDIQEQYPLDREATQALAQQLRISHPCYPGTSVPCVLTADFLLTMVRDDGELHQVAFNIKTDSAAEDKRTIDKLEIQRTYFEGLDVPHHLIFDSSIPKGACANLALIRAKIPRENEEAQTYAELAGLKHSLKSWLSNVKGERLSWSASTLCAEFDSIYGPPPGTALRVLAMLFYERAIPVNLNVKELFEGQWEYLTMPHAGNGQSILRKAA